MTGEPRLAPRHSCLVGGAIPRIARYESSLEEYDAGGRLAKSARYRPRMVNDERAALELVAA